MPRNRVREDVVYRFHELSGDAQDHAIEKLWDLNLYEWWQCVYEDAERVGLKIEEFDLDRRAYVKGRFTQSAEEVAKAILREHGDMCDSCATAKSFLIELEAETLRNAEVNKDEEYPEDFLDTEDIDREFLRALCEDYRIILQKEYEYLGSREAIVESIKANEYEFTEDGDIA